MAFNTILSSLKAFDSDTGKMRVFKELSPLITEITGQQVLDLVVNIFSKYNRYDIIQLVVKNMTLNITFIELCILLNKISIYINGKDVIELFVNIITINDSATFLDGLYKLNINESIEG